MIFRLPSYKTSNLRAILHLKSNNATFA